MSTITRLYLTKSGAAVPNANAGVAGPTSAITASQGAPGATGYILADSSVIAPTTGAIATAAQMVSPVTFCIRVASMDAGATGRIVLLEVQSAVSTASPTSVAGAVPVCVEHVQGGLGLLSYPTDGTGTTSNCAGAASGAGGGPQIGNFDEVIRIPWYDIPDAVFGGVAGANSVWYAVQFLSKNGTTLTNGIKFEAWLEF
jgi:hypothetical protein